MKTLSAQQVALLQALCKKEIENQLENSQMQQEIIMNGWKDFQSCSKCNEKEKNFVKDENETRDFF